jgi:SAM-dependent methyltransferase
MQNGDEGRSAAERIFESDADPAFRRRAAWIGSHLWSHFGGRSHKLLDIGCGRGFYFPLYRTLGSTIWGVERDAGPLSLARHRGQQSEAIVLDASAEALPFADKTFDAVVMSEILEHLHDPVKALREARRVLVPTGLLLVTVPNANYPFLWDPINWLLERASGRPIRKGLLAGIWANHLRLYTQDALLDEIRTAGFVVQESLVHTKHCIPFAHNIVYGIGKPLLEKAWLPGSWARSAERGTGEESHPRRGNPVAQGIRFIRWLDRKNKDAEVDGAPTVNICVMAMAA